MHLGSGGSVVVTVIAAAPKPAYALVVSTDGKVSRLSQNGTLVLIGQPVTSPLRSVAWKPDGSYALLGGSAGTLFKYDGVKVTTIPTVAAINTSIVPSSNAIRAIAFNAAGTLALLAGDNGMVLAYNGSTLTMLATVTSSWLYAIGWSPSGTAYIVGGAGTVLTCTNGTVVKLVTSPVTTTQYRGIAWKPQ